jgi:hypothetical protein
VLVVCHRLLHSSMEGRSPSRERKDFTLTVSSWSSLESLMELCHLHSLCVFFPAAMLPHRDEPGSPAALSQTHPNLSVKSSPPTRRQLCSTGKWLLSS